MRQRHGREHKVATLRQARGHLQGDGLGPDSVNGGAGRDILIGQGLDQGHDTSRDHFYGGRGDDDVQSRDVPAQETLLAAARERTPSTPIRPMS